MFKSFSVSGVLLCIPSARLKKFCWSVMIVKLTKAQKYSEILKTISDFDKILLKFLILSSESFYCLKRLSIIPNSSLK